MVRVDNSYLCIDNKKIETRKHWCFFMHYFKHYKLIEIMIHTSIQSYHYLEEMLSFMNNMRFLLASLCSPVRNCCCVWGHCFLVFGSSKKSWLWCWWRVLVQTGLSLASRIQYLTIELVVVYNVLSLGSVFFLQFACYSFTMLNPGGLRVFNATCAPPAPWFLFG